MKKGNLIGSRTVPSWVTAVISCWNWKSGLGSCGAEVAFGRRVARVAYRVPRGAELTFLTPAETSSQPSAWDSSKI